VARRENDQIGLVVFGAEAFTQCPLTLDHGIVATFLDRVEIGVAGDATAIGSALGTAVKRLKDSQAKSRVIILLTDGRNNAGPLSPRKAAEIAKTFEVKVYTIGVGTRGQAPFVVDTLFGRRVVYQNVEIDEQSLKEIADLTGGAYFRAEDTASLERIYDRIDELEKSEITMESYMEYDEQFRWLVLPAVGLLLLEVVLLGTRFRKLP
jgi:Ca-activated chloride channel family protein